MSTLALIALTLLSQSDITAGPPAKDKPSAAGWGFWPDFPKAWLQTHEGMVARTKRAAQEPIDLVFLGDSITQGWGDEKGGKPIWDAKIAPLRAMNYGIGGDTTRQIRWRLDHGVVDGLNPKAVVLMIGTNNLYSDHNSGTDEEIADGISAVLQNLRRRLPRTKVLLMGVLPRQNDYFCGRIAHINTLTSKFADGKTVTFLDLGPQFLLSAGKVRKELYTSDELHLAKLGYEAWANGMLAVLRGLLN